MSIPYRPSDPLDAGSTNVARTTVQYYDVCGNDFPLTNPLNGKYCADLDGNYGNFQGYYNPDRNRPVGPRHGMARAYAYWLDAEWIGIDAAQSGTFWAAWGHKWTEYSTTWEAGWSFGCGPGFPSGWGCGPSYGISFRPEEETKAKTYTFPLRYCFGNTSC